MGRILRTNNRRSEELSGWIRWLDTGFIGGGIAQFQCMMGAGKRHTVRLHRCVQRRLWEGESEGGRVWRREEQEGEGG